MAYTHAECAGTCSGRPKGANPFTCFGRCVVVEQNARENYTKIRLQLWHGTSSTSWTWNAAVSERFCRVDGSYRYLADSSRNNNPWTNNPCCLMDEEYILYHDSNGGRWVDVWMRAYAYAGGWGPGYMYVKNSAEAWGFNLPHIDRTGMTVTLTPGAITTTTLDIGRYWSAATDYCQYSINGGAWQDEYTTVNGINCTGNSISGLMPNTAYTIKVRMRKTSNWVWSDSNTVTMTTHPNSVTITTLVATSADPFSITVTASTNTPANTANIVVSNSVDSKTITGGSGTVTLTASPDTAYTITAVATTVRSGVTNTKTTTCTTLADTFCSVISSAGAVSPKHKLYLISSTGTKTEIKKSMCSIL